MLTSLTASVTSVTRALGTLAVDVVVSAAAWFIPNDYREQCLGDLYEGYFRLRKYGRTKMNSLMITGWRILTLIGAGVQMRWEDLHSMQQKDHQSATEEKIEPTESIVLSAAFTFLMLQTCLVLLGRQHKYSHRSSVYFDTVAAYAAGDVIAHDASPARTGIIVPHDQEEGDAVIRGEALAIVTREIEPNQAGRVKFQGTYWSARSEHLQRFPVEMKVAITGRKGNTLFVVPVAAKAYEGILNAAVKPQIDAVPT